MTSVGFELAIQASERPQTNALDSAVTEIDGLSYTIQNNTEYS